MINDGSEHRCTCTAHNPRRVPSNASAEGVLPITRITGFPWRLAVQLHECIRAVSTRRVSVPIINTYDIHYGIVYTNIYIYIYYRQRRKLDYYVNVRPTSQTPYIFRRHCRCLGINRQYRQRCKNPNILSIHLQL